MFSQKKLKSIFKNVKQKNLDLVAQSRNLFETVLVFKNKKLNHHYMLQESLHKQRKNAQEQSGHDSTTVLGRLLQKTYQVCILIEVGHHPRDI